MNRAIWLATNCSSCAECKRSRDAFTTCQTSIYFLIEISGVFVEISGVFVEISGVFVEISGVFVEISGVFVEISGRAKTIQFLLEDNKVTFSSRKFSELSNQSLLEQ